ncbi:hypothetical protein DEH18_32820 [Streptomyces sp. NHF165]|uniref:YDG/SRA domain-containing protein n=1 Tax=Streptomyces sp. NHF165 TaxID=2175864 RepID=UPI00132EFD69|nr:YDG/SRA domain-containing protein [Streptomyces sp. NHF165]QHF97838.1 hypothetical protein DEH18_32820 [Streptomyces sp. NHF165]
MAGRSRPVKFGPIPGVEEGQVFPSRRALYDAGVHRVLRGGIAGGAEEGADSICMSGGYVDDHERADGVILYTGHGGRDPGSTVHVRDQSWMASGNAGLLVTASKGESLRVIEGRQITSQRKEYVYRGLYRIADYWQVVGRDGFLVCQFELHKLTQGQEAPPASSAHRAIPRPRGEEETEVERAMRRVISHEIAMRNSAVVRQIKQLYDDTCQICGIKICVAPGGIGFSNCAHIKAIGKPYHGPDIVANALCLCPNCHIRFDRGALVLTDNLFVVDTIGREGVGALHRADGHHISIEYVRHHRSRWPNRVDELPADILSR